MSLARFIADQRTKYRVPHTVTCLLLGVSLAWFYKWLGRATGPSAASGLHTARDRRRDAIDRAVRVMFTNKRGLHGSPRLHADLRDDGWEVSEKTVADSMRRQGLVARRIKRRNGLTRQDKTKPAFPDLLRRDFTADRANARWVGDMTQIPTGPDGKGPKLYLATVIDLYSRRLLGAATGLHPDAELAWGNLKVRRPAVGRTLARAHPGQPGPRRRPLGQMRHRHSDQPQPRHLLRLPTHRCNHRSSVLRSRCCARSPGGCATHRQPVRAVGDGRAGVADRGRLATRSPTGRTHHPATRALQGA